MTKLWTISYLQAFACISSWFSARYIQPLLFTRLGFRHVEETQLVSLEIFSDTGTLTNIFAVLDSQVICSDRDMKQIRIL